MTPGDRADRAGPALRALARSLHAGGHPLVLVTGRNAGPFAALAATAGVRRLVVAGETTRLAVAAGVILGGSRAVAVLDTRFIPPLTRLPSALPLAVTAAPSVAVQALAADWPVLRPARSEDVGLLVQRYPGRALVLLQPSATLERGPGVSPPQPPPPLDARGRRWWRRGSGSVAIVASGPAVASLPGVTRMLAGRGLDPVALELAVLTSTAQRRLLQADEFLVGGPEDAAALARGRPPDRPMHGVHTAGRSPRALMDAVLAEVRV